MLKIVIFLVFIISSLFSSTDIQKVSLQLTWKYQFEFAGFIAAKEKGFYKDVNLDVDILEYKHGISVIDEVKNQRVTFGLHDSSFLNLYDRKKPIILLANYFKRAALVLITKQDIVVPEDLKGKKVMYIEHELNDSLIGRLLRKHQIKDSDFISVKHDFTGQKFIDGEVDATTAFISNELYNIIKAKVPYRIMDPQNYGMNGGGLNLFTSFSLAQKNPKMVNNFIEASKKGWEYALENKEEIIDIIYNKYSKIKTKDALLFEANETKKLMMHKVYDIGEVLESVVIQEIEQLKSEGKIDKSLSLNKLLFNKSKEFDRRMSLTKKEEEYLKTKKEIKMCVELDSMPYEKFDNNGNLIGVTSEYINLIEEKLDIPITLVKTKNWLESLDFAKKRKCDILPSAMKTTDRLKYLNFTSSYLSFPAVIVTRRDKGFIPEPEDILTKEKIGIIKGYSMEEILKSKYPNHKIVDVKNVNDGLNMVKSGEIFGFVESLFSIVYSLSHSYIGELKISGKFDRNIELGIAVRNDDEILFEILEKAVQTISESAKQEILNKYISVKVESDFNYTLFYQLLFIATLIILFIFYRHKRLLEYNQVLKSSIEDREIILSSVMEGIYVFENQVCIELNNAGLEIFEYKSKDEMIGKKLKELVSADAYSSILSKVETKDTSPYEIEAIKVNGEPFPILVKASNALINSKNVMIIAVLDITEVKYKDKLLFQQTKMAAMGEMIENIAHQWRQPLSIISTASTSIELREELGIESKEENISNLKEINKTAQHLSQTIEDFRNFFKKNKEIKTFSISKVIEKNLTLLAGMLKTNDIQVIKEIEDDIVIQSYENEFTQALLNIFKNAKDAMVNNNSENLIFIKTQKVANHIVVLIRDSGGGIDKGVIDKIFEPYFTTKHRSQGTGIGLYMTHQIIKNHMEGDISVSNIKYTYENKNYKGAQFIIKLPFNI